MRKTVWLFLLLVAVSIMLFGCKEPPSTESTASAGEVEKPVIGVAENPGSDMAEYDPNRTLYVSVGQFDMDLYPDIPISSFNFQILSLEPLDPETISVSLPLETKYISFVTDVNKVQG